MHLFPNKWFGQLLDISHKNFKSLKTFNSHIEVWFTDQNSNPLEIEDEINITIFVKCYGFLSFAKNMGTKIGKNMFETLVKSKNLSCRYHPGMVAVHQKLFDRVKKSATHAIKTSSKRLIQKTAETTSNLIGNKIANRITKNSKSLKKFRNCDKSAW